MSAYSKFLDTLLPGNYALTKSMELTRISDSGTLWYTKKYLVLYYYVFLSKDIYTDQYVEKVIKAFDIYINGLDESVKEDAKRYFYPNSDSRNFKSNNFKTFSAFANKTSFSNEDERIRYRKNAKKCYFAILMGTGGQGGIKEQVVKAVHENSFNYSQENIHNIIHKATVDLCIQNIKGNIKIGNNGDLARVLSNKAKEVLNNLDKTANIDEKEIIDIISTYPCSREFPGRYGSQTIVSPQFSGIESDCFASIRNDRQVLYYFGYFHSKSQGATDNEASSLTPIGELALEANAYEFFNIWEHQKIKMISQPPVVDIDNVPNNIDGNNFAISYSPYMDVLEYLSSNRCITTDDYKYVISRRKHIFTNDEWSELQKLSQEQKNDIKATVTNFGRRADNDNFDGPKELKKYLLGIRSDLAKDREKNFINICSDGGRNQGFILNNESDLLLLIQIYNSAFDYKNIKYSELFLECENDLKTRYISSINGKYIPVSRRTKLHWDLYNINADKYILLCSAIATSCIAMNINNIINISKENKEKIADFICRNAKDLFKRIGIKKESSLKNEIKKVISSINNKKYDEFIYEEKDTTEILASYKESSSADLMAKINEISDMAVVTMTSDRTRNTRLVSLLKAYYMAVFMENETLKCESCGAETFITKAGEPYMEFHHLIPFNIAYGPDHYLNLFALCPVCHRKIHYLKEEDKRPLYIDLDNGNYLHKRFSERLNELNLISLLKTYHLDYLLDDNAISQEEYDELYSRLAA